MRHGTSDQPRQPTAATKTRGWVISQRHDQRYNGEHHVYTDDRRHPVMVLNGIERHDLNRAKNVRSIARALPAIDASIAEIVPTQNWVHRHVVDQMRTATPAALAKAREPVVFVRKDGHQFLADGHHRLVTAILSDRPTLHGHVLDFD